MHNGIFFKCQNIQIYIPIYMASLVNPTQKRQFKDNKLVCQRRIQTCDRKWPLQNPLAHQNCFQLQTPFTVIFLTHTASLSKTAKSVHMCVCFWHYQHAMLKVQIFVSPYSETSKPQSSRKLSIFIN